MSLDNSGIFYLLSSSHFLLLHSWFICVLAMLPFSPPLPSLLLPLLFFPSSAHVSLLLSFLSSSTCFLLFMYLFSIPVSSPFLVCLHVILYSFRLRTSPFLLFPDTSFVFPVVPTVIFFPTSFLFNLILKK